MSTSNGSKTWLPVPTHPGYFVTVDGQIRGPSGRVLRPMRGRYGHLYILATKPRRPRKLYVHRAVLLAVYGPSPNPDDESRHLDGNPSHNAIGNLAWGTSQENADDKQRHGTQQRGEQSGTAKLTAAEVLEIRRRYGTASLRALGAEYGVSHTAIRRAALGMKWAHLTDDPNGAGRG